VLQQRWDPIGEQSRGYRVTSPFRLLGQYADDETGLTSTRFRFFDPEVGRWCSPDPLGLAGGPDLNGWNGAPTAEMDPLGLSTSGDPHLGRSPAITPGDNRSMLGQAIANTNAHRVQFPVCSGVTGAIPIGYAA
jgi:RHS repeat-associated protein